jgi:hypothetical protein
MILGLDPGTTESAIVALEAGGVVGMHDKLPNDGLLVRLRSYCDAGHDLLAIEDIEARGMAVGRETFETAKWIGRFAEAWQNRGGKVVLIYRRQVKIFHCGSAKAGDSNIRAAIIDRYGGQPAAIGLKRSPGPLFGIKADRWSALAVALTAEGKPAAERPIVSITKIHDELPF